MKDHFTKLRRGNIIGIIDSYGAIHSEFTGEKVRAHDEFWQGGQVKWRWSFGNGVWCITSEARPNKEQYWEIVFHLNKKYSIPFFEENGYHDYKLIHQKYLEEQEKSKEDA